MQVIELHFDGGCKPNPGQGYGSYELLNKHCGYSVKQSLIQFGFMTCNMAEYTAFIHGIKRLWHDSKNEVILMPGSKNPVCPREVCLQVRSDSLILVKQMTGHYKSKKPHLTALQDEARLILKEFGHWNVKWNSRKLNIARFGH